MTDRTAAEDLSDSIEEVFNKLFSDEELPPILMGESVKKYLFYVFSLGVGAGMDVINVGLKHPNVISKVGLLANDGIAVHKYIQNLCNEVKTSSTEGIAKKMEDANESKT